MQTFLPFSDFVKCASVLDRQRLGKQRVECLQILQTLSGESKGWNNHPAVRMWRGYEMFLCLYALNICTEWKSRGYKDTCEDKIFAWIGRNETDFNYPDWLGDEKFHASHRAALLHKNFAHYSQFGWKEKPELNYIWPTTNTLLQEWK